MGRWSLDKSRWQGYDRAMFAKTLRPLLLLLAGLVVLAGCNRSEPTSTPWPTPLATAAAAGPASDPAAPSDVLNPTPLPAELPSLTPAPTDAPPAPNAASPAPAMPSALTDAPSAPTATLTPVAPAFARMAEARRLHLNGDYEAARGLRCHRPGQAGQRRGDGGPLAVGQAALEDGQPTRPSCPGAGPAADAGPGRYRQRSISGSARRWARSATQPVRWRPIDAIWPGRHLAGEVALRIGRLLREAGERPAPSTRCKGP